jgi:hypothetical protein
MLPLLRRPPFGRMMRSHFCLFKKVLFLSAPRALACLSSIDQALLRAHRGILGVGHIDVATFDKSSHLESFVLAPCWFDFPPIVQSLYVNRSVLRLSTI